jgi:hypothetical protein
VSKGPLSVRWHAWTLDPPQAGAIAHVHVELENAGSVAWRRGIYFGYHWLDERGNALIWDGERTDVPYLEPGERGSVDAFVRAPIPPGRYRLSLDLVAELRAWFAELGGGPLETLVDVAPRNDQTHAELPDWVEPAADWPQRVADAHAEGYGVVAGAIEWDGGVLHPRPHDLDAYRPGRGRIPGFTHALLCPSIVEGVELTRLPDVGGLPAFVAPTDEPWIYDGRIVLTARPAKS